MDLQNFNLDLRPKEEDNLQVVLAHSTAQNAFLIVANFITEKTKEEDTVKIIKVDFLLKYLNNTTMYVNIKKVDFLQKDNKGLPAFKFCLEVGNLPNYRPISYNFTQSPDFKLGGNDKLRFHLDYDKNCGGNSIGTRYWPCLTNNIM